ncbi:MAG: sulfurtransferase TusA family protein [Pseudomonadales bacterium]|jgi:tRNA 2-thiouridine synthesizing protein A
MLLSEHIESLESGDQVQLISTDPASKRDVPKYCSAMGHHMAQQSEVDDRFEFLIQLR